jgi:hypothetical protein
MGTAWAREHGMKGKGGDWNMWEDDLRIREYPMVFSVDNGLP